MRNWEIHKAEDGASYWLQVGRPGVPGSHRVDGLRRDQVQPLQDAIWEVERHTRYDALAAVRAALDIKP